MEEIVGVRAQLRLELSDEGVSDAVGVIHLLLVRVGVQQVDVVRHDLRWGRLVARFVPVHIWVVSWVRRERGEEGSKEC